MNSGEVLGVSGTTESTCALSLVSPRDCYRIFTFLSLSSNRHESTRDVDGDDQEEGHLEGVFITRNQTEESSSWNE